MAQDKDKLFEKIYFMWKGEGEKRNQSIDFIASVMVQIQQRLDLDLQEQNNSYKQIESLI